MNKLRQIIEYRSSSQREDFLEYLLERGIDEDEREEIVSIILSYLPTHNDWTLVLLIDLSNDEKIISKDLLDLYIWGLLEQKKYYTKLSILDYIMATYDLYKNVKINYRNLEKLASNKKDKLLIRNQALLALIQIDSSKQDQYIDQLKQNLRRTKSTSAHMRIYNTLLNIDDFYGKIHHDYIYELFKITYSMDLAYKDKVEIIMAKLKTKLSITNGLEVHM